MSMMVTEAEFTAAMEKAVSRRGEDWRYPKDTRTPGFYYHGIPTYSDEGGTPTCLIGAAIAELGWEIPEYKATAGAVAVLGGKVPYRVMIAARCAQIHQDRSKPWGEALEVYRLALKVANESDVSVFGLNDFYFRIVAEAKWEANHATATTDLQAMDLQEIVSQMKKMADVFAAMKLPDISIPKINPPKFSYGGIASGGWVAPSQIVMNIPSPSSELVSLLTGPLAKKDHALTA